MRYKPWVCFTIILTLITISICEKQMIDEYGNIIICNDYSHSPNICDCPSNSQGIFCDDHSTRSKIYSTKVDIHMAETFKPTHVVISNYPNLTLSGTMLMKNSKSVNSLFFLENNVVAADQDVFRGFKNLETLVFSNTPLPYFEKDWLSNLGLLKNLTLTNCSLTELKSGLFVNAPDIVSLDLSRNRDLILPSKGFYDVDYVKYFSLSDCDLRTINMKMFETMRSLEELDLSKNLLTKIPLIPSLNYVRFTRWHLQENLFRTIPPVAFANYKSLMYLDLSRSSNLESIKPCAFCGSYRLKELDVSHSPLEIIDSNAFGNVDPRTFGPNLQTFRAKNCQLNTLAPQLLPWNELNELRIDGNPLVCDCDLIHLVGQHYFAYHKAVGDPRCASPPNLEGKSLKNLKPEDMCQPHEMPTPMTPTTTTTTILPKTASTTSKKWFASSLWFVAVPIVALAGIVLSCWLYRIYKEKKIIGFSTMQNNSEGSSEGIPLNDLSVPQPEVPVEEPESGDRVELMEEDDSTEPTDTRPAADEPSESSPRTVRT